MSAQLDTLYIQTNTFCFIDSLPVEILEAIFIHRARDYFDEHNGHTILTAPDWVYVSYVSRHWREVALDCHSLWSYLFIVSPRWTEELLARSKQAPLKLYMDTNECSPMEELSGSRFKFLEQAMSHLERIEELHLYISSELPGHILSKLSFQAPHLRILDIGWFCSGEVLTLGSTPALGTLVLRSCPVAYHSLGFELSRLTELTLYHVPVQFQQDMLAFLTTLRCMHNLEHLLLRHALPSAIDFLTSTAFHTFQKIKLPRLSFFDANLPLSAIIAFLSCVQVPLKTCIGLYWDEESEESFSPSYCTTLNSLLAERFTMSEDHAFSIPTIRSLNILSCELDSVWVSFSTSDGSCCSRPPHNFPLKLSIPLTHFTEARGEDYPEVDIFTAVPLSNVQSLHIFDYAYYPRPAFWKHLLKYLPNIRYIELQGGRMSDLPPIFSVTPEITGSVGQYDDADSRGHNQILAPALEELKLSRMRLESRSEPSADLLGYDEVRSLCDALATRKESQGRLTMTQCTKWNSEGGEYYDEQEFDIMGWWGGGRFHVSTTRVVTLVDMWPWVKLLS